jgi:hypothetical protein
VAADRQEEEEVFAICHCQDTESSLYIIHLLTRPTRPIPSHPVKCSSSPVQSSPVQSCRQSYSVLYCLSVMQEQSTVISMILLAVLVSYIILQYSGGSIIGSSQKEVGSIGLLLNTGLPTGIYPILKYFTNRPHLSVPTQPLLTSFANWNRSSLEKRSEEWNYRLNEEQIGDALSAVQYVVDNNISLPSLTKVHFVLPSFAPLLPLWKAALDERSGIGVVLIKNTPVQQWSVKESEIFWWGLGLHLGLPGAQNGRGDLIGHVVNEFHTKNLLKAAVGKVGRQ